MDIADLASEYSHYGYRGLAHLLNANEVEVGKIEFDACGAVKA
jgi:hypothetical protein